MLRGNGLRFNLGIGLGVGGGAAGFPAFAYQTETDTLAASFGVAPTTERKRSMDRVIRRLKTAGVWTKATGLYLIGNTEDALLKNWKTPGTFNLTKVGSPVFTANSDFT